MQSIDSAASALTSRRWGIGILIIFTTVGFGFGNWLARLPGIRDHLDATTAEMSLLGLMVSSGSLLGLFFADRAISKLGHKRVVAWSMLGQVACMPIAAVLLWFGADLPAFLALVLFGFSFSIGDVAMNVNAAAAERAIGRPRMPLFYAGYTIGAVSAMGTGALAEVLRIPVPIHLAVVFAIIGVCSLSALRLIPRPEAETEEAPPGIAVEAPASAAPVSTHTGQLEVIGASGASSTGAQPAVPAPARYSPWRDRRIVTIGFITLITGFADGAATNWMPLALTDHRGFENSAAALTLGVFFISMTAMRLAGSSLVERFGRVAVLRTGITLIAAGIITMNLVPFAWASIAAAVLWGVGNALGFPIGFSAAADRPATAVRDVATVSIISFAAYLVGPVVIGFLGQQWGLLNAFLLILAGLAFSFFAAGAMREPERRPAPPSDSGVRA